LVFVTWAWGFSRLLLFHMFFGKTTNIKDRFRDVECPFECPLYKQRYKPKHLTTQLTYWIKKVIIFFFKVLWKYGTTWSSKIKTTNILSLKKDSKVDLKSKRHQLTFPKPLNISSFGKTAFYSFLNGWMNHKYSSDYAA